MTAVDVGILVVLFVLLLVFIGYGLREVWKG